MQSWMLSVIQSRRQPTFCTLVWELAWLVDAGYIYPHGLVDGHGHGCWDYLQYPPSLFPPKNRQALVRLQLLSAVQHMHERLPFLLWGRMGGDGFREGTLWSFRWKKSMIPER